MANKSANSDTYLQDLINLPDFTPFYAKALPSVPVYCDPVFSSDRHSRPDIPLQMISEGDELFIDEEATKENEGVDHSGCYESVDDGACLQPPGTVSTPFGEKPVGLQDICAAPRKPIAHLPRIYQRPKTLFDKTDTDWERVFPVGQEKYVTVSKFRGRKSVHVRQFYMDKYNRVRPTQKGIVLTPQEWNNLTKHVVEVNKALES